MKTKDLIKLLQSMPQDADVKIIYDGEPRLDASIVYESVGGDVMITDENEPCYSKENRPKKSYLY